jgi:DNA polymerase-4/DNA polymerase V
MSDIQPVSVSSWPQAIVHIDGDSFFASCEQAMHREYEGKPVVVGGERGIATAMSQEAKELGVERGMQNWKIQKQFPEAIIVPSDYESYSLFSVRMFDIVRRHTPEVEEYSIDECFADITGLRKAKQMSYEEIAKKIKEELQEDLGVTFSVGLAPSKVVAKIATEWRKPDGFTAIKAKHIHHALKTMQVGDIWGIGSQTAARLEKLGVETALAFAQKNQRWVSNYFHKPQVEIWQELQGYSVKPIETQSSPPKSINKTKTFSPPSMKESYVFSQLSKNIENACIRARRHNLYTDTVSIFLKTADFMTRGTKFQLSVHTNNPKEIVSAAQDVFAKLFSADTKYRTTGVRFTNLVHEESYQRDLFNQHAEVEKLSNIFSTIDEIDDKYGKHTVCLASSMEALTKGDYQGKRGQKPKRKQELLTGENKRQRIAVPYLGTVS